MQAPVSNNQFRDLEYENEATTPHTIVNIKDWITKIGSGTGSGTPPVDALSDFDRSIDASIGGLGTKMEKMYKLDRLVPLVEFRNLDTIMTEQAEGFMTNVDSAIQDLHKKFAAAPTKRKRDAPPSCIRAFGAAATVVPVDPPSQPSCAPAPASDVKDSHEGQLQKAATWFCHKYADSTVQDGHVNIAHMVIPENGADTAYNYKPSMGKRDVVYDITITSLPGCTPNGGFNLAKPVASAKCADLLHNAWDQYRLFFVVFFLRVADKIQVKIKDVVDRSRLAAWSTVSLRNFSNHTEGRNQTLGHLPYA